MFHSRNPIYRNPTGAVQAHTPYGWGRIYKTGKNTWPVLVWNEWGGP